MAISCHLVLLTTTLFHHRVAARRATHPPGVLLGDKAYSARRIRDHLRRRRIRTVIAEPADQTANRRRRGSASGRPLAFDRDVYRQRNTVERAVRKLKAYRAVAMRSDEREYISCGTVDVASMRIWLRDLTRHPSNTTSPSLSLAAWILLARAGVAGHGRLPHAVVDRAAKALVALLAVNTIANFASHSIGRTLGPRQRHGRGDRTRLAGRPRRTAVGVDACTDTPRGEAP